MTSDGANVKHFSKYSNRKKSNTIMKYFIKIHSNKPKNDVNVIIEKIGYQNFAPNWNSSNTIIRFIVKMIGISLILACVKQDDILFIQYPMKKCYSIACTFAHLKGAKVITLIHDLGSFRRKKLTPQQENKRLSHSDYIILHNESMMAFVMEHGSKIKLSSLELFDYLSPITTPSYNTPHSPWKVIYAGGLSPNRNLFLYQLDPYINNWNMELFGKNFDTSRANDWQHIHFKGLLPPDTLLSTVKGDFGLVWDGNSIDQCSGNWGEYLRVNNPHKTSFYLRGGMPVIIWKEAALAAFIEKNKIGICVNSLQEINEKLAAITTTEYKVMRQNAKEISQKVELGYFTQKALLDAETFLHSIKN